MTRLPLTLLLLVLAGCATEAKYQQELSTFKGADEVELIRRWGPPAQVYEAQGHRFYVYKNSSTGILPGSEPMYQTNIVGNTAYTRGYGGTPATLVNFSCVTIFEIADARVVGWSYRGNDCVSQ